ncbi:hypothetical protein MVEN_02303100 [Mycena venus]|uniref:CBM-cenC domain-containing protein n=1 Tax=Mycena venus TaxID=2733690 RepID=A0A8H6X5R3_9AGAR|nr:hypothetical protein MVEN_02303100 [Mycena venus]
MPSSSRLLALAALVISSARAIVPPGQQGAFNQSITQLSGGPMTDASLIAQTVGEVNQKSGAPDDEAPDADIPPTGVTAIDGVLTSASVADVAGSTKAHRRRPRHYFGRFDRRQSGFEEIFPGLPADQHDAAIEGTAYLTYTLVPNSTYNIDACLAWAATIDGCGACFSSSSGLIRVEVADIVTVNLVFVNLYYEFNNYLLDFVFSEESNLKCAAYADIHTAAEKTNFGGQASYPQAGSYMFSSVGNDTVPLTFITQSSGWGLQSLIDPADPDGYELVFGPTGGANNAPGYMGFAFIDKYDVDACAQLCNGRGIDPVGGGCAYFNIWRALVDGIPTTYTCAMYYLVTDESTADNTGQGDLVVTFSRGYKRISVLPDGGFEGYTACSDFCFTTSDATWIGTSPSGGDQDATIFFFPTYAYTGNSVGLLGAAFGDDSLLGTLSPAAPLATKAGVSYVIQCFMNTAFSGADLEASANVDITWNGATVGTFSGFSDWQFVQATVTGTGSDQLAFVGSPAPAWAFIDNCFVYQA